MGASATKRIFRRLPTAVVYKTLTLEVFIPLITQATSTHIYLHHTPYHANTPTYTTPHSTAHHTHTPPERALGDRCIACVVPAGVGNRQYKDSLQRRKKMRERRQEGQVQHMHTTLYRGSVHGTEQQCGRTNWHSSLLSLARVS